MKSRISKLLPLLAFVLLCTFAIVIYQVTLGSVSGLHRASYSGDMDRVRRLLNRHPDRIDQLAAVGLRLDLPAQNLSPLMWAVAGHRHDVMKYLVDNGANVNQTDTLGGTPLMIACARGDLDAVEYLLQHGADANVVSTSGASAAEVAMSRGFRDIAQVLFEHGADPSRELEAAFRRRSLEDLEFLLQHGAKASEQNLRMFRSSVNPEDQKFYQRLIEKSDG